MTPIEELREGEVWLEYLPEDNLHDLQKVLDLAFPKETYRIRGVAKYYGVYLKNESWSGSADPPKHPTERLSYFLVGQEISYQIF